MNISEQKKELYDYICRRDGDEEAAPFTDFNKSKVNPYLELKNRHQTEINNFPLGCAFCPEQFKKMMTEKFGLAPEDVDKIYRVGSGMYVRKSDFDALEEILDRHEKEIEEAIRENKDDYLYHLFDYELANHEYSYTGELNDTLDALGLTFDDINADARMVDALRRAIENQQDCFDW